VTLTGAPPPLVARPPQPALGRRHRVRKARSAIHLQQQQGAECGPAGTGAAFIRASLPLPGAL